MKTSLQFFKDLGVCDGAYAALSDVFEQAGVEFFDYDAGYQVMLGMEDELRERASASGEDGHTEVAGWFEWCFELRNRADAIMFFNDHIEKNEFKTEDGLVHLTREEAEAHIELAMNEIIAGYRANFAINGIEVTDAGETLHVLTDPETANWATFDKFTWSEMRGGMRYETTSPTEALAHHAYQSEYFNELEEMKVAQKQSSIKRLIADSSDTYEVWV